MSLNTRSLRRADPRSEVNTAEVRGILSRSPSGEHCSFLLWDISDKGLRLWTPVHIAADELVRITIAKPSVAVVTASVRWCKQVPDHEGYQVGLHALDGLGRLEALHRILVAQPRSEHGPLVYDTGLIPT